MRLLDLTFGASVAYLVNDQIDGHGTAQVAKDAAGHGCARVSHQHPGHAMEWVCFMTLLHGVDQHVAEIFGRLGAQDVLQVQRAAGMVSDHVTPQTLTLDLFQVGRFAIIENSLVHHLGAVIGQIELGGD